MKKLILLLLPLMIGCTNIQKLINPSKSDNKTTTTTSVDGDSTAVVDSTGVDSPTVDSTNLDLTITLSKVIKAETFRGKVATDVHRRFPYGTTLKITHIDDRVVYMQCFDGGVVVSGKMSNLSLVKYLLDSGDISNIRDVKIEWVIE